MATILQSTPVAAKIPSPVVVVAYNPTRRGISQPEFDVGRYRMSRDPVAAIIAYNRRFVGRYEVLLQKKSQNLAKSPFKFFRGTFHLFARDMAEAILTEPPVLLPAEGALAVVGDIHGENYGAYKAEDGSVRLRHQ